MPKNNISDDDPERVEDMISGMCIRKGDEVVVDKSAGQCYAPQSIGKWLENPSHTNPITRKGVSSSDREAILAAATAQ